MRRKSTINQEDSLLEDSQLKIFLSKQKISVRSSKSVSVIHPKLQYENQNHNRKQQIQMLNANKIKALPIKSSIVKNISNKQKYKSFSAMKVYFSKPKQTTSPLNVYKRLSLSNLRLKQLQQKINPQLKLKVSSYNQGIANKLKQKGFFTLNKNNESTLKIYSVFQQKLSTRQNSPNTCLKPSKIANEQKLRMKLKSACALDRRVNKVINDILNTDQSKKSWNKKPSFVHKNKYSTSLKVNSSKSSINLSISNTNYQNISLNDSSVRPFTQLRKREKLSNFTMKPKSVWQNEKKFKKKHFIENPFKDTLRQSEHFYEKQELIDLL